MYALLWLIAAVLVIAGIVTLVRGSVLGGIVLIVVGLLVGPGGVMSDRVSSRTGDGHDTRSLLSGLTQTAGRSP